MRDTHDDALQTLSALVDDEHTTRTLGRDLYDTWRAVQKAREKAGEGTGKSIRSTALNLKKVKVEVPDLPKEKKSKKGKKKKSGLGAGATIGAECRVLETLARFEKMLEWIKATIIEGREQEAREKRRARAAKFHTVEEEGAEGPVAPGSPERREGEHQERMEEPDSPRTQAFHEKQSAEDEEWIDTTYKLIDASRTLILTDQGSHPGAVAPKRKRRTSQDDEKVDAKPCNFTRKKIKFRSKCLTLSVVEVKSKSELALLPYSNA